MCLIFRQLSVAHGQTSLGIIRQIGILQRVKANTLFHWFGKKSHAQRRPSPRPNDGERIYAIGDVHGRVDLLKAILKKISDDIETAPKERKPRLIFLGDYIDRGDNSREVLEMLSALKTDVAHSVTFLRGNHEAALLDFLADPVGGQDWLGWGGVQTIASFGIQPPAKPYQDKDLQAVAHELGGALGPLVAFLQSTELSCQSGDYLFAHAGIDPAKPIDQQSERALLWGSSGFREDTSPRAVRVVHGHYDTAEPEVHPYRIGIDTGAYYSGRLTAMRLDEGEALIVADVFDID